jgi:transposase
MQDRELDQQLPGLGSPWSVSEVELRLEDQEILVRVEHPRGTKFPCPDCSAAGCARELACYDHAEERRWRHLDSCQCRTILVARVPRVLRFRRPTIEAENC